MGRALHLGVHIEEWHTRYPFRITGLTRSSFRSILVQLSDGTHTGRGEGLPVHYMNETAETLYRDVEWAGEALESGKVDRSALLELMPPGGARKAVDSALWDLEAKSAGKTIWELTGIRPKPLLTAFTIGIEDTPEEMAARAREASPYRRLKIKVDSDRPVERVEAIRAARPDAELIVDANQGWTFEQLVEVGPQMASLGVKLIEQPLRRAHDEKLEEYRAPVPLSADESCLHRGELEPASRRYQILNIKLEKAGGLTEGLLLAQAAREKGLKLLLSNMGGTSLSMAPAFVLAQQCDYAEIDGQLLLKYDRFPGLVCEQGRIAVPHPRLWG